MVPCYSDARKKRVSYRISLLWVFLSFVLSMVYVCIHTTCQFNSVPGLRLNVMVDLSISEERIFRGKLIGRASAWLKLNISIRNNFSFWSSVTNRASEVHLMHHHHTFLLDVSVSLSLIDTDASLLVYICGTMVRCRRWW
jgi:hypothetical protein